MKEYNIYVSGKERDAVLKSTCLDEKDWTSNFDHKEQANIILEFLTVHVPYQTMVELNKMFEYYFR